MTTTFATAAQSQINRMRNLYRNLIAEGYTDQTAHNKVVALNGDQNYNLVCIATDRAFVDYSDLYERGIAQ